MLATENSLNDFGDLLDEVPDDNDFTTTAGELTTYYEPNESSYVVWSTNLDLDDTDYRRYCRRSHGY